jgi:hypothetical protein
MCFSSMLAAIVGLSAVNCEVAPGLGPDPVSRTDAIEISLPRKETGLLIKCPQGTADCISRAQAICQGRYRVVSPAGRGPKVQALVNLSIEAINADNPYEVRVVCE